MDTDTRLPFAEEEKKGSSGPLVDRYVIPPFSVFDTRQGYWIDRRKTWMSLGIQSEIGRNEELTYRKLDPEKYPHVKTLNSHSTSVFDPVLCEVLVRWFSKPGCQILDPFAGGSVRGIVSTVLGRKYLGIELRDVQVQANISQLPGLSFPEVPIWIQGDSREVLREIELETDFLLSCPPYADLEVYSDHPKDLSTMGYPDFLEAYESIIEQSCSKLKNNRFAAFVVSEVRNKRTGIYRGFVSDTIRAFEKNGLRLYNDVVMLNQVGTAAIRANNSMKTRKMVRIHQNVLIFVKGDPKKAVAWLEEPLRELTASTLPDQLSA
jgi:hypothetical protein